MISIHIGQAGVQIGESCWELYCHEHAIAPDGTVIPDQLDSSNSSSSTFFSHASSGKFVPRSIFADLEPSVVGTSPRVALILLAVTT